MEMKSEKLTIHDVIQKECGISLNKNVRTMISSPLRSDGDPSFRVFPPEADGTCNGAYDFGTGKSYTPYSLIKELYDYSPADTFEHIRNEYGVDYNPEVSVDYIGDIKDKIDTITANDFVINNKRVKAIEIAINKYLKGDRSVMEILVEKSLI